jgi:hypothetical protein
MCTINSVHALRDIRNSRLNEAAHAKEAMAGFQLSQRSGRNAKSHKESESQSEGETESEDQEESGQGEGEKSKGQSETQSPQNSQKDSQESIAHLLDIVP